MGYFDQILTQLSDGTLDERRAEKYGELNSAEAVHYLELLRAELRRAEQMPVDLATSSLFKPAADTIWRGLQQVLAELLAYAQSGPAPNGQDRDTLRKKARVLYETAIRDVRPFVITDTSANEQKVAELLRQLEAAKAEYVGATEATRNTAADKATKVLAGFYDSEAKSHADSARTFLVVGAVGILGVVLVAVFGFFVDPPQGTADLESTQQVVEFIGEVIGRAVLLSLAGYVAGFGFRNYRVNMHLATQNRRRDVALKTSDLLREANSDGDVRNIIVHELVRSLFSSEETGYLGGEPERTVIESSSPVLGLVRGAGGSAQHNNS